MMDNSMLSAQHIAALKTLGVPPDSFTELDPHPEAPLYRLNNAPKELPLPYGSNRGTRSACLLLQFAWLCLKGVDEEGAEWCIFWQSGRFQVLPWHARHKSKAVTTSNWRDYAFSDGMTYSLMLDDQWQGTGEPLTDLDL